MNKGKKSRSFFKDEERQTQTRASNIIAAKGARPSGIDISSLYHTIGVADAVRTSLGPRGMDKMVRYKAERSVQCFAV